MSELSSSQPSPEAPRRVSRYHRPRTAASQARQFEQLRFYLLTLGVFLMTEPMTLWLSTPNPHAINPNQQANFTLLALQVLAVAATAILAAPRLGQLGRLAISAWPMLAFVALPALSLTIAVDTKWSTYHYVFYLLSVFSALSLCALLGSEDLIRSIALIFGGSAVFSLAVVVVLPAFGLMNGTSAASMFAFANDHYAWRGIYFFKNFLGHTCGITIVPIAFYGRRAFRRLWLHAVVVGVMLLCLVAARSAGGYLIAVALLALQLLVLTPKGRWRIAGAAAIVFGGVSAVLLKDEASVYLLNAVGKDETLSGRTAVWTLAEKYVAERPVSGHGFNFTASTEASQDLLRHLGVLSVHNAFLDAIINLGWTGLAFWVLAVVLGLFLAWRRSADAQADRLRAVSTLIVAGVMISANSESIAMAPQGPEAVLLLLGVFGLYRAATLPQKAAVRIVAAIPAGPRAPAPIVAA